MHAGVPFLRKRKAFKWMAARPEILPLAYTCLELQNCSEISGTTGSIYYILY